MYAGLQKVTCVHEVNIMKYMTVSFSVRMPRCRYHSRPPTSTLHNHVLTSTLAPRFRQPPGLLTIVLVRLRLPNLSASRKHDLRATPSVRRRHDTATSLSLGREQEFHLFGTTKFTFRRCKARRVTLRVAHSYTYRPSRCTIYRHVSSVLPGSCAS